MIIKGYFKPRRPVKLKARAREYEIFFEIDIDKQLEWAL